MPILTLISAVFTSIFVSGEFHNGTIKNYLLRGCGRTQLFLAKYSVCAVAVTAMLLAVWLLMMAYTAVFTAVGMTLRSSGASIGVNICLVSIFPTLLSAVDFIVGSLGIQISGWWLESNLSAVATMTPDAGALPMGAAVGIIWLMLGITGGTALFCRQDIK